MYAVEDDGGVTEEGGDASGWCLIFFRKNGLLVVVEGQFLVDSKIRPVGK